MNQSDFLAIACKLLPAWEKSLVQGAIGFDFGVSYWLRNKRNIFKPITKRSNSDLNVATLIKKNELYRASIG